MVKALLQRRISNMTAAMIMVALAVAVGVSGWLVVKAMDPATDLQLILWIAASVFALVLSLLDFVKELALKDVTPTHVTCPKCGKSFNP